jgi:protease II
VRRFIEESYFKTKNLTVVMKLKHDRNSTWVGDNKTIFYYTRCERRSDTVLKHKLGTDS